MLPLQKIMETVAHETFAVPIHTLLGEAFMSLNTCDLKDTVSLIKEPYMHSASLPIEIVCVTLTGQKININIDINSKVIELKKNIYKKTDIMLDDQRIVFGGKQLDENNTLASYNIKNGEKVHLVTRLRGGMFHSTSARADFVSLNFNTKFQKGSKMIYGLKQYGIHLDTLSELEKRLQRCETDLEIDKIYALIERIYTN
jgi:hypothetical protein